MKYLKFAFLGLLAVFLTGCGVEIVDTGHVGVKTTFGKVQGDAFPEGLYFYNPFSSDIVELDTRTLKWENQTQAYTRDVQQADVHFTINYRLDPSKAATVYQQVGTGWAQTLIGQVVFEQIKREFGQHEAVDLVAQREAAARSIEGHIREQLATRNILLTGFQLTNIDYTPAFEKSVEAKVVAQQRAIEEQNHTAQIKEQAAQKVLAAEAEAQSIKIRAQALEQNAKLVEWEAVQKWDGKLPQYQLGGATPFITLGK